VFDSKGREFIDLNSGLWSMPLGQSNKPIFNAIQIQMKKISYVNLYDYNNETVSLFASELCRSTRFEFSRALFTCSGSESIEAAIKIARKRAHLRGCKRKFKIASLPDSYHGTSLGAMMTSWIDESISNAFIPGERDCLKLPEVFCSCCPAGSMHPGCISSSIERLQSFILQNHEDLAAVLVEPVQGSAGVLEIPTDYLIRLRELTLEYSILLIFDEVATGFCRTGPMFYYQKTRTVPDLLCLSKAITAGYFPLGSVLVRRHLIEELTADPNQIVEHFSTLAGTPLACAAGIAALKQYQKLEKAKTVETLGRDLEGQLINSLRGAPIVREIRRVGLMIAIDLSSPSEPSEPITSYELLDLQRALFSAGLITFIYTVPRRAGISLFPPFTLSKPTAKKAMATLGRLILKRHSP
jgi:adenosylmethionine-8-amino-7-oxononanoate aminotransferase